jgi:hypothetical protein
MNNDLIQSKFLERRTKMSNEKDVSKELTDAVSKVLSRRDAVKKAGSIAAGAAIAFLGLNLPGVSQQKEALACGSCTGCCGWNCTNSCWSECTYECQIICDSGCVASCGGDCVAMCGDCTGGCVDYCTGTESR